MYIVFICFYKVNLDFAISKNVFLSEPLLIRQSSSLISAELPRLYYIIIIINTQYSFDIDNLYKAHYFEMCDYLTIMKFKLTNTYYTYRNMYFCI